MSKAPMIDEYFAIGIKGGAEGGGGDEGEGEADAGAAAAAALHSMPILLESCMPGWGGLPSFLLELATAVGRVFGVGWEGGGRGSVCAAATFAVGTGSFVACASCAGGLRRGAEPQAAARALLVGQVDWSEEQSCFRGVALALGRLYAGGCTTPAAAGTKAGAAGAPEELEEGGGGGAVELSEEGLQRRAQVRGVWVLPCSIE
jgi:hypothetical protein